MLFFRNFKNLLTLCLRAEQGNGAAEVGPVVEVKSSEPPVSEGNTGTTTQKGAGEACRKMGKECEGMIKNLKETGKEGEEPVVPNSETQSKGPETAEEQERIKVGFQIDKEGKPVLDSETIQSLRKGEGKTIDISIPKSEDGEEKSYSLKEILPPDVASITVDGRTLTRVKGSLTGDFIDPDDSDFRLGKINSDTSLEVSGIRTKEEMAELKQKANGIYESVLDQHPEYKGENMQEVRDLAMDLIEQSNLDDSAITEMIFRILTGDFFNFDGLPDGGAELKRIVGGNSDTLDGNKSLGGKANLDIGGDGLPVGAEVPDGLKELVKLAISQMGVTERNRGADKYLNGQNSKQIPWCAAFANWCLEQSGFSGTGSFVAESFIGGVNTGKHVGVYIETNGKPCILGGNQSNEVCVSKVNPESILGYYNPIGNPKISKPAKMPIPSGVFIVTGGGGGTR